MNPITKIVINNFQSHSTSELVPAGPGQLTVIVGQSRQGKTAIFRALRWLFYNAPDGDDFIRWGCTFARVTAEYADGTEVIRYRTSGGTNRYIIRKPGSQEQVYEGFGRGVVPLEVQQITGVSPVEIGEGLTLNINLAEQLDGPFLGNKAVSSTGRAKVLGKLAGTEEVDLAAKQLGTDLYRWKRDQEACEKEIGNIREQLKGYDYLPKFKANMDRLAELRDTIKAAMERKEKLEKIYKEWNDTQLKFMECRQNISHITDMIDTATPIVESIEKRIIQTNKLIQLKSEWDKNVASLETVQATIKATDSLPQAETLIRAIEEHLVRLQRLEKLDKEWNQVKEGLSNVNIVLEKTKNIDVAAKAISTIELTLIKLSKLNKLNEDWRQNQKAIQENTVILSHTEGIAEAEKAINQIFIQLERMKRLEGLHEKWIQNKKELMLVRQQIERTKGIAVAENLIKDIQKNLFRIQKLSNLAMEYDTTKKKIMEKLTIQENCTKEIEKLQTEYYKILKQIGKCPTCGGNINQEKVKEVL